MFLLYSMGTSSGSPLEARQTTPFYLIFVILIVIIAAIAGIGILVKLRIDYLKSDKFKEKEAGRPTKKSDVIKIGKQNNFTQENINALWEVCQVTKCNNIIYLLKNNADVNELFRNAYNLMKAQNLFTPEKISSFFEVLFKLEVMVAQYKKILSTTQIPLQGIIFYITDEGEQLPFTVIQNTKESFTAQIPEFIFKSPKRPNVLVRSRFTFKTLDGLSYNFISRIIRYDDNQEGIYKVIIAHTDQLECQAQRHYKREFFQEKCFFAPVQIKENPQKGESRFILAPKAYEGKLSNISAGGCCIQTPLPIKEKQYISVSLKPMGIQEKVIGIIRRTRKLPTGMFALHIQFEEISLNVKNQIYTLVYKFEL